MSTRTIKEFADRQLAAMLPAVVTALGDGVTAETWEHIGGYVRTTMPIEFQAMFIRYVVERTKHDDALGVKEMRRHVIHSKLYHDWLNDRPMQDLLLGRKA